MYKYKNVSGLEQSISGRGLIPKDAEFTSTAKIENPNFELIESDEPTTPSPIVGTASAPQPNAVTEATKVETANEETK